MVKWVVVGVMGLALAAPALASEAVMADLLRRCAPGVAPETMGRIVSVESRGHVYAIADAGKRGLPWSIRKQQVRSFYPKSKAEAISVVRQLQAAGHTVSIGLGQVNDQHLARRGISVESLFDPCENLRVGAAILQEFYVKAAREYGPGQAALLAAISAYNSGSFKRGFAEGYVGLVRTAKAVPALKAADGAGGLLPVPSLDLSAPVVVPRETGLAAVRVVKPSRFNAASRGGSRAMLLRQAAMTPLVSKFEQGDNSE